MSKRTLWNCLAFLVAGFAALGALAQTHSPDTAADAPLKRERIEWCDIWVTDAEKTALPRVLLIGDSITRGYFDGVEKALAGKAYCARLTTSRSVCDPVFFQELELVLAQYPFSAIHFNNGLHGWGYTEEQYRAGMVKFIAALKKSAPGAKLMCATTTPLQKKVDAKRVDARNAIAIALCREASIPVDDLHAIVAGKPDYFAGDGVHFNAEGIAAQAKQVATAVGELLR